MIPTLEEFKKWCDKHNIGFVHSDVNHVYSFFSSSHERVMEEIEKLQVNVVGDRDYDIGFNHGIQSAISLIQPKEDGRNTK